jgi:hypothetical protein
MPWPTLRYTNLLGSIRSINCKPKIQNISRDRHVGIFILNKSEHKFLHLLKQNCQDTSLTDGRHVGIVDGIDLKECDVGVPAYGHKLLTIRG